MVTATLPHTAVLRLAYRGPERLGRINAPALAAAHGLSSSAVDLRRLQQAHRQDDHRIRHDWGLLGAHAITTGTDVAVVIDVLSFTTTLSVATDAGIEVLPYLWANDGAAKLAAEHEAVLAVGRRTARPGQISLSASTVRAADPPPKRLVLPSPNGSTIAHYLADRAGVVIGACLRNATAAATWINAHYDHLTASVAVISAGEQWPDGSLRPAVEDLWGAGAVLEALVDLGWRGLSPEAAVARGAFRAVAAEVPRQLAACASGRELSEVGFSNDVDVAAEVDEGRTVPVHDGRAFIAG